MARPDNRNLDVLKYAMSILIILIHLGMAERLIICRVAVPVFFVVSSYLFFSSPDASAPGETCAAWRRSMWRYARLYAFWFVALLPLSARIYDLGTKTPGALAAWLIEGVAMGNTFPASWYITACMICLSATCLLRRHDTLLLSLGAAAYTWCCLASNYYHTQVASTLTHLMPDFAPDNSFLAGLLFVAAGKAMATRGLPPVRLAAMGVAAGTMLLFAEDAIIARSGCRFSNDCYLSLAILAPAIVACVLKMRQVPIATSVATTLRHTSTIYYCAHIPVISAMAHVCPEATLTARICLAVGACTIVAAVIIFLSKRRPLGILRYAY